MYEEEIIDKPYMLNVDYLIFGYDMSEDGIVTIRDIWLKKVWEITRRMEDFISAIEQTVYQNPKTREESGDWLSRFLKNYKAETGIDLNIPRWNDIKDRYDLKTFRRREKAFSMLEKAEGDYAKWIARLEKVVKSLRGYELSEDDKGVERAKVEMALVEEKIAQAEQKIEKAKEEYKKYDKQME